MPARDVLVVGDLLVDVVVVPEGPLERASDTPAAIRTRGGGSAANTASWLARSGCQVRLVAAVGEDSLGRAALGDLYDAGVAWAGETAAHHGTGTCVVLVDADGERTMLPDRGANDALSAAAVERAMTAPPAWLHLSGYALLGEGSRDAGLAAVARSQEVGVPLSVDAASTAPLRHVGSRRFLQWIDGCTVLFANDDEIAALGGVEAALEHCHQVVTKHGARGASWTDGTSEERVAALEVVLVDTVGAGDAFNAGYIDAAVSAASPLQALTAGVSVAADAVARPGARP